MKDNPGLLMFFCTQSLRDCVYFVEERGAVVIAEYRGTDMLCYDVFCGGENDLAEILSLAAGERTDNAVLGFAPVQNGRFSSGLRREEDTTLFLLAGGENPFEGNRLMFPLLSRA